MMECRRIESFGLADSYEAQQLGALAAGITKIKRNTIYSIEQSLESVQAGVIDARSPKHDSSVSVPPRDSCIECDFTGDTLGQVQFGNECRPIRIRQQAQIRAISESRCADHHILDNGTEGNQTKKPVLEPGIPVRLIAEEREAARRFLEFEKMAVVCGRRQYPGLEDAGQISRGDRDHDSIGRTRSPVPFERCIETLFCSSLFLDDHPIGFDFHAQNPIRPSSILTNRSALAITFLSCVENTNVVP